MCHNGLQLRLLLFSVGKVHFGVDAEQIETVATYNNEQDEDLFWFHKELGYGKEPVDYFSPVTITIRTGLERSYRVIIDSMEEIAAFSCHDILPLPPLVEPFALQKGVWGVLPGNGKMVFLMDFKRLLAEIRSADISMPQAGGKQ